MTNLVFSDLETEVYDHCGLTSADQTRVDRWLNYVQQDICGRWPWPFLLSREAVATIPDYTTGTITSVSGTTVTGSSTAWTTTHGDTTYFIQFNGNNDFYNVASRGGVTSLTLQTSYQGATVAAGSTYILRKFFYSLSSSADEVIDVRNWNTPIRLIQADLRTIDTINPLVQSTSPGYAYMMFGVDSSMNNVFMPYPFPNDARLFEFRTKKRPTDGAISIPNKYAQVIAWGAIAVGFAYLRKFQEAAAWNQKFESKINDMKAEYRQSEDNQQILGSIDSVSRSRFIQFPENYPRIGE